MADGREEEDEALAWPLERSDPAGDFRIFRVRRDWCRSPGDGSLQDFYVLDMPDWVQIIPLTPEGRLVMVEQFRPGTRAVTLEFPAGVVEPGESAVAAAVRELEEETGHCGDGAEVIGDMAPNAALQNNALSIVVVRGSRPRGTKNEDRREHLRHRIVAEEEIDRMLDRGDFRDAYGIAAWYCFRRWRDD